MSPKVLVTGVAGFIGNEIALKLAARGDFVVGIDNLNNYYDVSLKRARLARLPSSVQFIEMDLADGTALRNLFASQKFDMVLNLAAQAGVRYSLENPQTYIDSNVTGFLNILECCRYFPVQHLVYASSSSVYGENDSVPFSTNDRVDNPRSLYAATKKMNELMASTYHHLFGIRSTGLRFFTVYGPWGRPDMAPMLFAKAINAGKPISVFNNGDMRRDFTFVEDIVEGTIRVLDWDGGDGSQHVFNIGRGEPIPLLRFIEILEEALGKKAIKNMMPMQPGDVPVTWADTKALETAVNYRPQIALEEGVRRFAEWYKKYYQT